MKICGVYKITNTINNKVYIGGSVDIYHRWEGHTRDLKLNQHHSRHLQKSWLKHGEKAFHFEIIKITSDLNKEEQYYIDYYKSYDRKYGYNIARHAGRPFLGQVFSLSHLKNLSESHLGNEQSSESIKKIKNALKGRYAKTYTIVSPMGEIITFTGIYDFAKRENLKPTHLRRLFRGLINDYKGWTRAINSFESTQYQEKKEFCLFSPSGKPVKHKGLREFCRLNNLDRSAIHRVIIGKSRSHKGWRKV